MQSIAFCNRCRGMKVGWNKKYILHRMICRHWLSKSLKLMVLTGLLSSFVFAFPVTTGIPGSGSRNAGISPTVAQANALKRDAATRAELESMLVRYHIDEAHQKRLIKAIIASSKKYKVDPRLVASIVIVESGANPFAVSPAESVGIMQIHVRTWGRIAENENINLFKIEDNVDFGVRILRDYIVNADDTWEGVSRYRGKTSSPESQQSAGEYVQKVQGLYGVTSNKVSLD
jgi:hypothetical protein